MKLMSLGFVLLTTYSFILSQTTDAAENDDHAPEVFDHELEAMHLSNITQLTFPHMGFEKAGEAYFSPDGQTILFQAVPLGKTSYQIYIMDLNDLTPKMVSTGKGACTCAYFKPNNNQILFASSHSDPSLEDINSEQAIKSPLTTQTGNYRWDLTPYMNIYEAERDGSNLISLTSGPAYHAECAYSSDGSQIVYASNEDGSMNLYRMNSDGTNVFQLTKTNDRYNGGPFFSPDDQKIIFRADHEKPDYLQIFSIDADGSNQEQITDNAAVNWAPYWHPNGKVIAFTTSLHGHRHYEIYLLNLETQIFKRLTHHEGFDGLPAFSHDGNKLMWTSKRSEDHSCQIFIADFVMPKELEEPL